MASDGLFLALTHPIGLVIVALAILIPCLLWAQALRTSGLPSRRRIIAVSYLAALAGLLVSCSMSSYLEFSSRVSAGILEESQRWSVVPGWTLYMSVLSLLVVLPLLAFIGVPVSAVLLRRNRFSVPASLGALCASFMGVVVFLWLLPSNEWHRTHRFESLLMIAQELSSGFILVGGAFLAALLVQVRNAVRLHT